ncbi:MAG: hypothetical protein MR006_03650, partial [Arcanobacterium sp.]|nr:hypothetical protein [Arcanobacterium sp.]
GTAAAASSSDGEAPAIEAAGSVHNASDGRGGAERGGAQSAGAIQMRDDAGGFRKSSFSQLRGRSEERLDGRSGARSAPVDAAASAAVATPRDGAAKPTLADPRYQPMPSFTPEPAQAPAEKPTQSPVSGAPAAEPAARQRAQTSQSPEHEMQNVPSYQPSAPPSGSTSAVPSGNSSPAVALDRVRAAWEQIVAQASAESKIAGNILKHATGVLAVEGGRVLVGFTDEGTASGFNHNKRAHTALAHALSQVVGAAVQTEGQVGAPASDARPKGDSANTAPNTDGRSSGHTSGEAATDVERGVSEALEAPEPLEELEGSGARGDSEDSGDPGDLDDSPELDPVYGLTEENDEPDPAGVLGQLLDSSEDSGAELESEGSKAAGPVPVEPGSMGPEAARPAVNSPVSLRSAAASADVPFFEQEMPQLPPTELPASLARRYAATESSAPHGERTRAANAYGAHGNRGADSFAALREFREPQFPPDEPELHGEFRSKFRGEQGSQPSLEAAEPQFENPWDEVSADDPEISQSTLVGLNVVLAAFPGSEVAEVQNNNDDLA